jgi:hypothetical protein
VKDEDKGGGKKEDTDKREGGYERYRITAISTY